MKANFFVLESVPSVAMKVEKRIPRDRLANGTEFPPVVWSLQSAAAESDALLVVDSQNSSLKRVSLASGALDVVYRSSGDYKLRGAAFVADAQTGRTHSIVLAEMRANESANTMAYSLVVAELRGTATEWTPTAQRFALDSAPSALNWGYFPSLCAVHTNRVLCAVYGSSSLDVLAVPSAREARKEASVPLGFAQLCFTSGLCDGTTLLFVTEMGFDVRILEVRDGVPLALQLLRRIDGGNRLLWCSSGLLFCTDWNAQSDSHAVRVWRVSGGGRRVERLNGTPIAHAENVRINCWTPVGEKVALCDAKTWDIVVYSYLLEMQ